MQVSRRTWITVGAASAGVGALGLGLGYWTRDPDPSRHSIDATLAQLKALSGKTVESDTSWLPGKVFSHCAQSVNFSMDGFPSMKSSAFQNTLGSAAFGVFSHIGKMRHDLEEPIPGAPDLAADISTEQGLAELISALERFQAYRDALKPHFAFGALSWDEFELAHVFHINNHFEKLKLNA